MYGIQAAWSQFLGVLNWLFGFGKEFVRSETSEFFPEELMVLQDDTDREVLKRIAWKFLASFCPLARNSKARLVPLLVLSVIIGIDSLLVTVREAPAIPAFSRKYQFDCSVCHVPSFPKLNDFEKLFRERLTPLAG